MNGPVVLAVPPAPGSADPANLYVDLQSRALWLGVAPEVDPAGAVLISDIVQTQADIVTAEAAAKAYTDEQIVTRAPVVHTHTASQIIDFEAAVEAVTSGGSSGGLVIGMIIMWSGLLTDIGRDALADWRLCDGSLPGIPDLREKFVIGAGHRLPGKGGPPDNPSYPQLTSFQTPAAEGTHSHTVSNHVLTVAQLPRHRHTVDVSGDTDNQGAHEHRTYTSQLVESGTDVYVTGWSSVGLNAVTNTSSNGSHDHSVVVNGDTGYVGSDAVHNHGLTGAGTHQHTVTSQNIAQTIPWFALAYIIKIA